MNFGLVGDGNIAKYHKAAIEHVGGKILAIEDPKYGEDSVNVLNNPALNLDYIVICSPTYLHRKHILQALENPIPRIIVEKPMVLPWEPVIDLDIERINVVLQLRWLTNLPAKADRVEAVFVRDEEYFQTWKGDARNTGGLFYNLFIHYISLAIQLDAEFMGMVIDRGDQRRIIKQDEEIIIDITQTDNQVCYNAMYESIINGWGIRPRDLYYLNWICWLRMGCWTVKIHPDIVYWGRFLG